MDKGCKKVANQIKIGIICFDLQEFTADFINRLSNEVKGFAEVVAYPLVNIVCKEKITFKYKKGITLDSHRVVTLDKTKKTPEALLVTPNIKSAISCAVHSDIILHYGIHSSTALIASLMSKILRKKQISVNQTLPLDIEANRSLWIKNLKKIIYRLCDEHIYQTFLSKEVLSSVYGISHHILHYAPFESGINSFKRIFNEEHLTNETRKNPKKVQFLFVGNLLKLKGIVLLIEGVHRLVKLGYNIECLIIGGEAIAKNEPRISELKEHAKSLGVEHEIKILGKKTLKELCHYYNKCDVFVLPTKRDTFGKVIAEAEIAGKPIITSTACGAVNTLVFKDINGYIFRSGDIDDLVKQMTKMFNPEIRLKMGTESVRIINKYLLETANEASYYRDVILKCINTPIKKQENLER